LAAAPTGERLVTHCETYFHDPHAELRRVLAWLGMHATEDRLERACGRINPSLVHHRVTVEELVEAGASDEVVRYYLDLCEEAEISAVSKLASRVMKSLLPSPAPRIGEREVSWACPLPFRRLSSTPQGEY
jgi:hypothetical protein